MNEVKVVNRETGEVITVNATTKLDQLSLARKVLGMQIKELESRMRIIDEYIEPHILQAFEAGENKLANYWDIQKGARRFDREWFEMAADPTERAKYDEAKEVVTLIEEKYKTSGKPYLKFPRL